MKSFLRPKILTRAKGHCRFKKKKKEEGFFFKPQITAPLRCVCPISGFENATILKKKEVGESRANDDTYFQFFNVCEIINVCPRFWDTRDKTSLFLD